MLPIKRRFTIWRPFNGPPPTKYPTFSRRVFNENGAYKKKKTMKRTDSYYDSPPPPPNQRFSLTNVSRPLDTRKDGTPLTKFFHMFSCFAKKGLSNDDPSRCQWTSPFSEDTAGSWFQNKTGDFSLKKTYGGYRGRTSQGRVLR